MSYSQQSEETFILEAVNGKCGVFLDIGAWHPKTFSNTRALFELGWTGVMVEPSPEPFLSLLKEYGTEPRITLIQAALGLHRGFTKFYATADAVSTTDTATYHKWEAIGGFYGSFWVPVLELRDIIECCNKDFDFVNIDAEGVSVDLLKQLLVLQKPRCICVEFDDRKSEARDAAVAVGYRITHDNGTNLIMVHGS